MEKKLQFLVSYAIIDFKSEHKVRINIIPSKDKPGALFCAFSRKVTINDNEFTTCPVSAKITKDTDFSDPDKFTISECKDEESGEYLLMFHPANERAIASF